MVTFFILIRSSATNQQSVTSFNRKKTTEIVYIFTIFRCGTGQYNVSLELGLMHIIYEQECRKNIVQIGHKIPSRLSGSLAQNIVRKNHLAHLTKKGYNSKKNQCRSRKFSNKYLYLFPLRFFFQTMSIELVKLIK